MPNARFSIAVAISFVFITFLGALLAVPQTEGAGGIVVANPDHSPEHIKTATDTVTFYATVYGESVSSVTLKYHLCNDGGCGAKAPTKEMTNGLGNEYSTTISIDPTAAPLGGANSIGYWLIVSYSGGKFESNEYKVPIAPSSANNRPICRITSLWGQTVEQGSTLTIQGTASDSDGVKSIQVQLDGTSGAWIDASGKDSWSYALSASTTSSLSPGKHTLYARALDNNNKESKCDDGKYTRIEFMVPGGGATPNDPLQAHFSYSPANPKVGQSVQFTDESTGGGTIVSWEWDFNGDGKIDAWVQNPSHAYAKAGTYIVRLTVTDDAGETSGYDAQISVSFGNSQSSGSSSTPGFETAALAFAACAALAITSIRRKQR